MKACSVKIGSLPEQSLFEVGTRVKNTLTKIRIRIERIGLDHRKVMELTATTRYEIIELASVKDGALPEFAAGQRGSSAKDTTDELCALVETYTLKIGFLEEPSAMKVGFAVKRGISATEVATKLCLSKVTPFTEHAFGQINARKNEPTEIETAQ